MNKKFLSAILFGALMVTSTGTFVSCKDYDDDIENLQGQIDKLATKEDMTSQIATLQAALDAAKTDAAAAKKSAEESLAKATAAEKAAAQAALDAANAKLDAIKAAQDEVAKIKTELEATIDSKFEAAKSELAKTIAELTNKVEELTGLTTDMITSIVLQEGSGDQGGGDTWYSANYLGVNYNLMPSKWTVDGKEVTSITFGEKLSGAITLNANELFSKSTTFLVSVSPANAAVSAEMLSLINSKGESLDAFLNLEVAPYKGLLVRSAAGTGLHAVTASLKKDIDFKAFAKAVNGDEYTWTDDEGNTGTDNFKVRFAVAATKKDRTVTSAYNLGVMANKVTDGLCNLAFNSTIKSSIKDKDILAYYANYNGSTTTNNERCYPVMVGEAFQIAVNPECGSVLASYITVDLDNANLSTTDKAAIKSLTITGVDAVSKTNNFDVTIAGAHAKGVVVPLKVTAMGFNGQTLTTVVWVKAGENTLEQTAEYTLTPSTHVANPTVYTEAGYVAEFKIPTGATKYTLSLVAGEEKVGTEFKAVNQSLNYGTSVNTIFKFYKSYSATKKEAATKAAEVAYAEFVGAVNLQTMKENVAYTGTIQFFDAENTYLGVSTVKVKKVLPTAFPAAFSAKTNAINEGVLTVYPEPETGVNTGAFAFSKAFNGLDGANALSNIVFSSSDVNLIGDADNAANAAFTNGLTYTINAIKPAIINDGKTYGAKVAYDYGDIAYEYKTATGAKSNNWSVDWATKFSIKFGCMIVDSKYAWTSAPVVYYNEDAVIATAKKDVISVKDAYNAAMDPFKDAVNWNKWAVAIDAATKVTLKTTNEEGKVVENEYFNAVFDKPATGDYKDLWTLKLTKKSTEVVLKDDVKTDVVITITDKFGHKHDVPALSFTMKKSH